MKGIRLTVTALMLMSGTALALGSVPKPAAERVAVAIPQPDAFRRSDDSDVAGLLRQQVSLMREQANMQKELVALQHELLAQGRLLHEGRHGEEAQSTPAVNEQKGKTDE